jgi:putative methionine-R-sulfoxide reductase with GAF domain
MSLVNNLNIRVKLLVVILSFLVLVVTGGFIYTYQIMINSQEERTLHYCERQLVELENVQEVVNDNARNLVTLLSTEGVVRDVLNKQDVSDVETVKLIDRLRNFKSVSLSQANIVVDVAIYLPSGKRFYSTKQDFTNNSDYAFADKGSDVPASGYKMTFDGLEYVSSYPIFSKYEQLLGRIEVSFLADQFMSKLAVLENENVAILVRNKELLKYNIKSSKSSKVAKYHIMARTSVDVDNKSIAAVLPDVPLREVQIQIDEDYAWALKPMLDITESNIGYFVFRIDRHEELNAVNSKFQKLTLTMIILVFLVSIWTRYIAIVMLTRPLRKLMYNINEMAQGHFPKIPKRKVNDEITEIYTSLDALNNALQNAASFADDIRNLNFKTEYNKLSDGDTLGESLIRMRNQLEESEEQKKLVAAEEQLKLWKTEAWANLTSTLRANIGDLNNLSEEVTKTLLKTVGASYGAFYIIDSEKLKPMALIAGDSSKQVKAELKIGEGLVGEAAADKEISYIENVPEDYIQISSGLGETKPKSLMLLPLENHDVINGIIEIASMKKLEKFEIEFLKEVASSISSSISEVLINMETQELLEQSQQQAEELAAQEEEMRQNLEELQATQEEAYRREIELKSSLKAFQDVFATCEFDSNGKLVEFNRNFMTKFSIPNSNENVGQEFAKIFASEDNQISFRELWNNFSSGPQKVSLSFRISDVVKEDKYIIVGVEDESGEYVKLKMILNNNFDLM